MQKRFQECHNEGKRMNRINLDFIFACRAQARWVLQSATVDVLI
jgi:hypothetical protein